MALKTLLSLLGLGDSQTLQKNNLTRKESKKSNQQQIVNALRQYQPRNKPSYLEWLRQRKANLSAQPSSTPGSGSGAGSGGTGTGTGTTQTQVAFPQSFPGKMPIRATQEAIYLIQQLKANMNFDRIQFPKILRDGEKIIGINMSDRSQDTSIGVVNIKYENKTNASTVDKIGINLDRKGNSNMLDCIVVYPAIPTDLTSQSQPSGTI